MFSSFSTQILEIRKVGLGLFVLDVHCNIKVLAGGVWPTLLGVSCWKMKETNPVISPIHLWCIHVPEWVLSFAVIYWCYLSVTDCIHLLSSIIFLKVLKRKKCMITKYIYFLIFFLNSPIALHWFWRCAMSSRLLHLWSVIQHEHSLYSMRNCKMLRNLLHYVQNKHVECKTITNRWHLIILSLSSINIFHSSSRDHSFCISRRFLTCSLLQLPAVKHESSLRMMEQQKCLGSRLFMQWSG